MLESSSIVTTLSGIAYLLYTIFGIMFIWLFARMSDNINKIRKMMEKELERKKTN